MKLTQGFYTMADNTHILVLSADVEHNLKELVTFADQDNTTLDSINENLENINNSINALDRTLQEIFKFLQLKN